MQNLLAGSTLGGVTIDGLQLATGVIIDSYSSAAGHFHALLKGNTLLGTPQQITVEGKVMQGSRDEVGGICSTVFDSLMSICSQRPFRVSTKLHDSLRYRNQHCFFEHRLCSSLLQLNHIGCDRIEICGKAKGRSE